MKNKCQRIPVEWTHVQFEIINIRYVAFQQGTLNLPKLPGERYDNPLSLKRSCEVQHHHAISQLLLETHLRSECSTPALVGFNN